MSNKYCGFWLFLLTIGLGWVCVVQEARIAALEKVLSISMDAQLSMARTIGSTQEDVSKLSKATDNLIRAVKGE